MKSVCVYCGSSIGNDDEFVLAAIDLANLLVKSNISIVYGGGNVGLMDILASAALKIGGNVVGVITKDLRQRGVLRQNLTRTIIVDTLSERKAVMSESSEGFIALPGGYGTLDELMAIVTESQLGYHKKPCVLFNVKGYYNALIKFIDNATYSNFISVKHRKCLLAGTTAETVVSKLLNYKPVEFDMAKWALGMNKETENA